MIVGERGVLVVDSSYLPSSAAEDIAQIRRWTDRPVRYLLNTHWHPDHQRGNSAYVDAFPDVTIVAHRETAKLMAAYDAANRERYPKLLQSMKETLATKPDAELRRRSRVAAACSPSWQSRLQLPTLTFDSELSVDLGNRIVEIRHPGVGDTRGDAVAYLPKEQILVTGDILVAPCRISLPVIPKAARAHCVHCWSSRSKRSCRVMATSCKARRTCGTWRKCRDDRRSGERRGRADRQSSRGSRTCARRSTSRSIAGVSPATPNNQEYFDESIDGLIKDAFYQAPK